MTWTYDETLALPRDQIRMLIGDVEVLDPQLSDESIAFFYTSSGDVYTSAINAALALSAKYSREANSKSVGSMSLSYQRAQSYAALADRLQAQAYMPGLVLAPPVVGGISKTDKALAEQDGDRVPPTFTRRGFDVPGAADEHRPPTESDAWGP
jgi:hypothetical protein